MHTAADLAQEKHELETVLNSGIFHRAPNLAQLLTYVCAKYFEGSAEQIKEYNIAVDALGRPPDFDQKRDSIVRVEAHRLRKRLREYYDADGAEHVVRIDIPPGQYAPRFMLRGEARPSLSPDTLVSQDDLCSNAVPVAPAPAFLPVMAQADSIADSSLVPVDAPPKASATSGAMAATGRMPRRAIVPAALLLVFCTGAIALWNGPSRRAAKVAASPIGNLPAAINGSEEIRILAGHVGGDYTDRLGRVWQADQYFEGGHVFETMDHPIFGTREPRIYQSRREGVFAYNIPLSPGVYELRLHFAETLYGENNVAGGAESSRVFNVYINGQEALHEFDVINEAGPSTADVRAFKDVSPAADGKLHLKFEPFTNPPLLSAIEITPGTPGRLRPIRMIALDRSYTDKQGRVWEPDRYARGGNLVLRTKPVEGSEDPELFRAERFGNIRYIIPVPSGRYGVTLYFAEAWFGPGTPPGGGPGSRVFDILANGIVLRHGFDIFREARGSGRATTFSTHGLEPDAQGKLSIALIPTRNYACINAIEVLDESR
ncbi:MAG TPA: malectin domain-containing carbohydrate-binding protein [Bryobacteraceae bacterium]